MYVYQSSNPCNCSSSPIPSTPSCTEVECNCLQLCDITEQSTPCGGELILDLTDAQYEHDTCACGANDQKWYLAYYDNTVFSSVTVSESGDVNATAISSFNSARSSEIIVKFICGNLSAFLTILVIFPDLCTTPCVEGEACNPCTGNCELIINIGTE